MAERRCEVGSSTLALEYIRRMQEKTIILQSERKQEKDHSKSIRKKRGSRVRKKSAEKNVKRTAEGRKHWRTLARKVRVYFLNLHQNIKAYEIRKLEHMNSYKSFKFYSERPGSSAKVYEYKNSEYVLVEGSKIPKFPKRTYSLEGEKSTCSSRKSTTRQKISTTSMIPRLEWKKQDSKQIPPFPAIPKENRKSPRSNRLSTNSASPNTLNNNKANPSNLIPKKKTPDEDQQKPENVKQVPVEDTPPKPKTPKDNSSPVRSCSSLEDKINKDFVTFKNNVLKIPEYWTDAGQTATSILKNAINIVSKQYPTVEKESFETEIQGILKATEAVKHQILSKTESIINKATQIYIERNESTPETGEEDLKKITKKMEELKNEVSLRKNVFGDLLKCGSEMKQLIELEKALKQKGTQKEIKRKEFFVEAQKGDNDIEASVKQLEQRKLKNGNQKRDKNVLQSCGDAPRQDIKIKSEMLDENPDKDLQVKTEEKTTQTLNSWIVELQQKEKALNQLNQQILELQQLCKDHISKFKSFNLQIKLRGICSKAQHMSVSKELQILNDEKMQLEEKNSQLECYNKDLESAIKQRDLDLHQKDKLINQQKKLLHVRDELIEMLKSRCNLEEAQRH